MQLNEQIQQKVEKLQILLDKKEEENKLFIGDNIDILQELYDKNGEFVDMIFADPPYFLSNDGFTCQNGKMVKVIREIGTKAKEQRKTTNIILLGYLLAKKFLKKMEQFGFLAHNTTFLILVLHFNNLDLKF